MASIGPTMAKVQKKLKQTCFFVRKDFGIVMAYKTDWEHVDTQKPLARQLRCKDIVRVPNICCFMRVQSWKRILPAEHVPRLCPRCQVDPDQAFSWSLCLPYWFELRCIRRSRLEIVLEKYSDFLEYFSSHGKHDDCFYEQEVEQFLGRITQFSQTINAISKSRRLVVQAVPLRHVLPNGNLTHGVRPEVPPIGREK